MGAAEEAWARFAEQVGGEYVGGRRSLFKFYSWAEDAVTIPVRQWTARLENQSIAVTAHGTVHYTRMRVSFETRDRFWFDAGEHALFSRLWRALGRRGIKTGAAEFDHRFILKSNNERKARIVFSNANVRELLMRGGPSVHLAVLLGVEKGGREYELSFEEEGLIVDVERLHSILRAFAETLDLWCTPAPPNSWSAIPCSSVSVRMSL